MKNILIIIAVIVLVAAAAAGGFWGGMTYQTNKVNDVQSRFEEMRGQFPQGQAPGEGTGQFPGSGQFQPGGRNFPGGGTSGVVKTIEGDVITISTAQDVTTVKLTADTVIQKTIETVAGDLLPDQRIMVIGETGSDGVITATRISIVNDSGANAAYPPPAGMEP